MAKEPLALNHSEKISKEEFIKTSCEVTHFLKCRIFALLTNYTY